MLGKQVDKNILTIFSVLYFLFYILMHSFNYMKLHIVIKSIWMNNLLTIRYAPLSLSLYLYIHKQ